ncbi:MAG: imidazole glycerol phosphate synthase subunit HisH [Lachnospiraceae bacterium]|nr:imidazole glycerol phosphate synthase subunit HisH [Lachnospiraceae bacterium]
MVAIIDYDAGNIRSVEKAVISRGADAVCTRDPGTISKADHVILPGVGAFGDAMGKLDNYGLIPVIKEIVQRGIPFLGICLGEQLLFERSEESPGVEGLGILKGEVRKFSGKEGLKVPNIGWNSIELQSDGKLFNGIKNGSFVYFVHSYYVHAFDREIVTATIDYGEIVDAAVEKGNVFATQFHPEKSSDCGMKILENFLNVH